MHYDITKKTAPAMPELGRGTKCIKLLLSKASKDLQAPLVPMLFTHFGAHACNTDFQYPDNSWKIPDGMLANLCADSGCNKGQLTTIMEDLCRDFRTHNEAELQKLVGGSPPPREPQKSNRIY